MTVVFAAAIAPNSPPGPAPRTIPPGSGVLSFERSARGRTVLRASLARSPLRLLAPRNHGDAAWVFLATLGGGLVDGDQIDARVEVGPGASALLGTQSSTKVYRSRRGCSQKLRARVDEAASLCVIPDPVTCFADSRYAQDIEVTLAPGASLLLLDGYTCGRSACGERWAFSEYRSRTVVVREGRRVFVDATRLDPAQGPIAERMGAFDAVLSLVVVGPRFAAVREAMLGSWPAPIAGEATLVAASPLPSTDGALVRVAAHRYQTASHLLRPSFAALARILGDDPFARKW
jgi:urease accessory protein